MGLSGRGVPWVHHCVARQRYVLIEKTPLPERADAELADAERARGLPRVVGIAGALLIGVIVTLLVRNGAGGDGGEGAGRGRRGGDQVEFIRLMSASTLISAKLNDGIAHIRRHKSRFARKRR